MSNPRQTTMGFASQHRASPAKNRQVVEQYMQTKAPARLRRHEHCLPEGRQPAACGPPTPARHLSIRARNKLAEHAGLVA
ncbi:PhzA/PhzB family protein [Pseudomonas sp. FEN]|uniref:PhzA/PhzB family protein n=1 Tax=Pseudomonas sp. FEN TaxID=2767468 RepID=UPI0017488DB6|nr:PhzA/PhzB family protein [Pseudomonas sp. FEN]